MASDPVPPNRIAFLRNTMGYRPVDLASKMGVTERTAYRWERGEVQIPDEKKLDLARFFKVTVPFLMGWPDESEDLGYTGPERRRLA